MLTFGVVTALLLSSSIASTIPARSLRGRKMSDGEKVNNNRRYSFEHKPGSYFGQQIYPRDDWSKTHWSSGYDDDASTPTRAPTSVSISPTPTPQTPEPTPEQEPDTTSPTPAPDPETPSPTLAPGPVTPSPTPALEPVTPSPTPALDPATPSPTPAPAAVTPSPTPAPEPVTPSPTPALEPVTPSPTPAPEPVTPSPTPAPEPVTPSPTPGPPPATPAPTPIVYPVESINLPWIQGQPYQPIDFGIGSAITFQINGNHNVYIFDNQNAFANCDFNAATFISDSTTTETFNLVGTFFYGCSVGSHCESGQKIQVTVH